jgi:hypothetical protein
MRQFRGLIGIENRTKTQLQQLIDDSKLIPNQYIDITDSQFGIIRVQAKTQNEIYLNAENLTNGTYGYYQQPTDLYIFQQNALPVFDNLAAQGINQTTTSVMGYGVNVFRTVTPTDYCTKLPQPITGKKTTVINMTTSSLVVYPSNIGGQINNLPIDEPVVIPPNGIPYDFICIENPLPGAWSWNAPATGQYDSGDITVDTTGGSNDIIAAANAANWIERSGGYFSATAWAYDGINNAPILNVSNTFVAFKPSSPWIGVTKVKVYTNLSATNANVEFGLLAACGVNYYDTATGEFVDNGPIGAGNYRDASAAYANLNQTINGATLPEGDLTANVGDAGTCWGEITFIGGAVVGGYGSVIGDYFQGVVPNPEPPPSNVNQWYTGYISFQIRPRQELIGFKFRFFIEHY